VSRFPLPVFKIKRSANKELHAARNVSLGKIQGDGGDSGNPFSSWHFSGLPWHFSLLAASGQKRTLLKQNSPEEWVQ